MKNISQAQLVLVLRRKLQMVLARFQEIIRTVVVKEIIQVQTVLVLGKEFQMVLAQFQEILQEKVVAESTVQVPMVLVQLWVSYNPPGVEGFEGYPVGPEGNDRVVPGKPPCPGNVLAGCRDRCPPDPDRVGPVPGKPPGNGTGLDDA
jgi:hypothetical protein